MSLLWALLLGCGRGPAPVPAAEAPPPDPPEPGPVEPAPAFAAWRGEGESCVLELREAATGRLSGELFRLPVSCSDEVAMARAEDGGSIALLMGRSAFRVGLSDGSLEGLPPVPSGSAPALGFGTDGRLLLFVSRAADDTMQTEEGGAVSRFGDLTIPWPEDEDPDMGQGYLGSAYTPVDGAWSPMWQGLFAVYEGDDNGAWGAMDAPELVVWPTTLGDTPNLGDVPQRVDDAHLQTFGDFASSGAWMTLPTDGAYALAMRGLWLEGTFPHTPIAVDHDGRWALLPDLPTAERGFAYEQRGRFLLTCAEQTVVHDLRSVTTTWKAEGPCGFFWPLGVDADL